MTIRERLELNEKEYLSKYAALSMNSKGRDKEEDDRHVVIKVKAMLNGISSITNTYKVTLQKDVKHWIEI